MRLDGTNDRSIRPLDEDGAVGFLADGYEGMALKPELLLSD